jgi:LysR family nitrogen assimilation transcriptional regulator
VNIKQLNYFTAIATYGSFVKGAAALHISQPSVSAQIKLLEEELGIQLLERRPDGVVLTLEGRDFLQHAYTILGAVDAARNSIRAYKTNEVGRVAVGIPASISTVLAVSLVEAVQLQLPNVQIRMVSGVSAHIQKWVMDGELDFGLVYADGSVPGADIENVLVEDLYLAARRKADIDHLLTPNGELQMRKLSSISMALPCSNHGLRRIIERATAGIGIKLHVKTEIDASEQLKQMVRRTGCFTILSLAALHDDSCEPLVTARIIDPPIQRVVSLFRVTGRPLSRAARRVENILFEVIAIEVGKNRWRSATETSPAGGGGVQNCT